MATMVKNLSAPPDIAEGLHLLEVTGVDIVDGTNFNSGEPEDRLKLSCRVLTKGHRPEDFNAFMSIRFGAKSRLGDIWQAAMGAPAIESDLDLDLLLDRRFKAVLQRNERGWPTIVAGSARPPKADEPTNREDVPF